MIPSSFESLTKSWGFQSRSDGNTSPGRSPRRGRSYLLQSVLAMRNIQLLHSGDTAQTGDLASHVQIGSLEHGLPGIVIGTGHIVIGMVAGNDHQRTEHHIGVTGGLHSLDDILAGSHLGLAFYGADKDVLVAQLLHLGLHLAVGRRGP